MKNKGLPVAEASRAPKTRSLHPVIFNCRLGILYTARRNEAALLSGLTGAALRGIPRWDQVFFGVWVWVWVWAWVGRVAWHPGLAKAMHEARGGRSFGKLEDESRIGIAAQKVRRLAKTTVGAGGLSRRLMADGLGRLQRPSAAFVAVDAFGALSGRSRLRQRKIPTKHRATGAAGQTQAAMQSRHWAVARWTATGLRRLYTNGERPSCRTNLVPALLTTLCKPLPAQLNPV